MNSRACPFQPSNHCSLQWRLVLCFFFVSNHTLCLKLDVWHGTGCTAGGGHLVRWCCIYLLTDAIHLPTNQYFFYWGTGRVHILCNSNCSDVGEKFTFVILSIIHNELPTCSIVLIFTMLCVHMLYSVHNKNRQMFGQVSFPMNEYPVYTVPNLARCWIQ